MTSIEDQVRVALQDMAGEARPAPLLERLDQSSTVVDVRRRRWVTAVAVAAVVATIAAGSVLVSRWDRDPEILPTDRPPKIFRLSDTTSTSPGRARLAVTLARPSSVHEPGTELYLLPATNDAAIHLPESERIGNPYSQQLSADGTLLIRMAAHYDAATLEIVNLVTGDVNELGGRTGFCPRLSPDNRTVAAYSPTGLHTFDIDSLVPRSLRRLSIPPDSHFCHGLGWSPDGTLLAVPTGRGMVVLDRTGTVHLRSADRVPVNADSAWSPDGEQILLYESSRGSYTIARLDGGPDTALRRPADAQRPLGWTGSRIVWLAGQPGDYTLITADRSGNDVQTWMLFEIGDLPIGSVSWTSALSGAENR